MKTTKSLNLLDQKQVLDLIQPQGTADWKCNSFTSFRDQILDENSPFPCYFAVEAEKKGLARYIFIDSPYDKNELERLSDGLYQYIRVYQKIAKRTTLVIFFKPSSNDLKAEDYKHQFWYVLQYLTDHDPEPWPSDIPQNPEDPRWEFCFGGEPIFVVARAPFYSSRRSRYTPHALEITMQPRGTLDDITGDTMKGKQVRRVIRERLEQYDLIPPHPDLGDYGSEQTREWMQYILPDNNEESVVRCPFTGKKVD